MGSITINSNPPGAEIWINGQKSQYFTPLYSPAYPYQYTIALKYAGYEMYTEQFTLQPGQAYTISATLVPLATTSPQQANPPAGSTSANPQVPDQFNPASAAATGSQSPQPAAPGASQVQQSTVPGAGSLSVTTNPAGATIFVDGIPGGASPATIPGLSAGMHNLTITKPGYAELITQVNIVGGQTMEFSTTLIPATNPTKPKSPGFAWVIALIATGIALMKR